MNYPSLNTANRQTVRYVQDERNIAGEHMDVRRDCVSFARVYNLRGG